MKKTPALFKLLLWLLICQIPGFLGAHVVYTNMGWYNLLSKPPFMPPNGIFGMVWGILYILLGVSAFLAFREKLNGKTLALFAGQLALNICWTPLFFGAQNLLGALLLLLAMLGELTYLFRAFWKINRTAAYLLLPYCGWLIFALYLTTGVWWLN